MIKHYQKSVQTLAIFTLLMFSVFSCTTLRTPKPFYDAPVANWQDNAPPGGQKPAYTVFLVGDAGAPSEDEPTLQLLKRQIEAAGEQSAIVFLGDNIYHHGLPQPGAYDRKIAERRLNTQLDILRNYKGEKYIIPGNHDWENGGPDGLNAVIRQEQYVEKYLADSTIIEGGNFFVPDNGCPGPFEIILFDNLVMIALNTQWWLHPYEKPYGGNNYCGVSNEVDMMVQLEDVIQKHSGKDIMVVGHHPLFTNGPHGGAYTLKDFIFPLTLVRPWLYLPLPIIGSMYPLARIYGGISQDVPHKDYQALKNGMIGIFNKYDNIVYAAGHEHSIQYFEYNNHHHIVSGSGCKTQHVRGGHGASFTYRQKGFARVDYYENGDAWVVYWAPGDKAGDEGRVVFHKKMYNRKPATLDYDPEEFYAKYDTTGALIVEPGIYADSTITLAANPEYQAGKLKRFLLGRHYRDEWATPVTIPYLDMQSEQGGLTPYRKGGGKQTASLKVRDPDGHEFTLRSIDKDPVQALPYELRETFAKDILQDQISAQHPYGAVIIPPLADAAGVYHVNPKIVYIPDDPRLRQYREDFKNTMAFFEEDADENHEDVRSLGYATNLVGTDKVVEKTQKDNDNRVDEQMFARARLFDMLIGDWDRHKGQWRWAEQEQEKGVIYEPVPEDRDQAFLRADGLVPWMATRRWGIRNIQDFGEDFGDYVGLNLTAYPNDRMLLSSVSRADWVRIANDMKASLSDDVIENAIREWPQEIQSISGPEVIKRLKSRRDLLPEVAEKYYEHISKIVDVRGTDKHERFEVNRINNEETQVMVYKITKEGEERKLLYNRTFYTKETKEIRLYGMDGRDEFYVTGNVSKGIKVRIIGGEGQDFISDKSRVGGLGSKTLVYDTKEGGNTFDFGPDTKDKTKDYFEVNLYNPDEVKLPYIGPRLSAEFNVDDGLFLGGGLLYRRYGFRKNPFSSEHTLMANVAFRTNSYNLRYDGIFTDVLGKWDVALSGAILGPQFQQNFYGLGNQTEQSDDIDVEFYRVRFARERAQMLFVNDITSFASIGIGGFYDHYKLEDNQRFNYLETQLENLEEGVLEGNHYAGVKGTFQVGTVPNPLNPTLGIMWANEVSYNHQLGDEKLSFTRVATDFKFFISPRFKRQVTWAVRFGGAHNFGDFRFYQASTLGGTENLRGYRRTRFAGRSSIYNNVELRVELFKFNAYLFPGKFGIMGLVDHGRVFADGESKKLFGAGGFHRGVGGGIWLDVLEHFVVNGTYSVGEDEGLVNVYFGFLF